jgi:hypothetical protein
MGASTENVIQTDLNWQNPVVLFSVQTTRDAEFEFIGISYDAAQRVLRDLGADIDLLSIVDLWQDTLPYEDILELLKDWNAGRPFFQTIYASKPGDNE